MQAVLQTSGYLLEWNKIISIEIRSVLQCSEHVGIQPCKFELVELRKVFRHNTFHGTSHKTTRGMRPFACERGDVGREIVRHLQGRVEAFGHFRNWKEKNDSYCPYMAAVLHF